MSQDDDYLRQAQDAQRHADLAQTDEHRSAWLRIAQGWLSMIKRKPPTRAEAFEDEVRARRTGPGSDEPN